MNGEIDTSDKRALLRFWNNVEFANGIEGCWLWKGKPTRTGYGRFGVGGRNVMAHRYSFELYSGRLGDMFACHTCDNRLCVNPYHLFPGTHADNAADRVSKNRSAVAFGEDNPNSKLSAENVREIRSRYAGGGVSQTELAKEFGVQQPAIWKIVNNLKWREIAA